LSDTPIPETAGPVEHSRLMFNSTSIVLKLARDFDGGVTKPRTERVRVKSDPCLLQRLPSTGE
jgi:hypothetical protein